MHWHYFNALPKPDADITESFQKKNAGHIKQTTKYPGPSCSKLTTSLVNVSLKFQTLILQIHCYFLLKKYENPLHCKGFSHFFNKK